MKKLILLTLLLLLNPLYAEEISDSTATDKSNIDYELSLQPKEDKTFRSAAMFRYLYSDEWSSKFFVSYETYKLEEKFADTASVTDFSQKENSSDAILDFYFLEYRSKFIDKNFKLRAGLAFNLVIQNMNQTADFNYLTVGQHSDNITEVWFYSPKIELEAVYKYDWFGIKYFTEYIPVYYYTFNQEISITPLVSSGTATNEYQDSGSPYIKNDILVKLWFLELQGIHEYQKLNFKMLNLAYDGSAYSFASQTSKYHISNLTLFLNFRINVFESSDLVLGAGKKYEKTVNDDTGEAARDRNQWIFNMSLMDKIF